MQERRSHADRATETRAALIRAARELFLEKGYAATSTPELADRAGLTRGALYHHYADKQDLFRAVIEAEAQSIAREIDSGTANAPSPVDALIAGSLGYFRAMQAPGRARLMLIEGPAVLGPAEMRRIDLETGGQALRDGLVDAIGPDLGRDEIEARADLVSAMFDRASLALGAGGDSCIYEKAVADLLRMLVRKPLP